MKILRVAEAPLAPNPHGVEVRRLQETPHVMASLVTLQPGESLKRHVTPVDVFFYVLEGHGIVEIGEERAEVEPHMVVDSPARIPHRLRNEGTATFRFLVVKTPRPTENTQIL